ncbi:MAG: (Fe-S)-binding protein [Gammaproteobacteria bacterium]|nr:(Fe-S)-binding protein [Gammaproteobacteria bacterium]
MKKPTYPTHPESVYFYGTCLVDLFFPKAGMAGIKLLQREGIEVIYPQGQSCCGQPAYNSGFRQEALEVARQQIGQFAKDIPVICPSGSCTATMRYNYPVLFKGEKDHASAVNFAARVFELSEFLVHALDIRLEDLGEPVKITWHGSCSMQRKLGIDSEPRALLGQLKNVELVELERSSECCGFGGTFAVKFPDISSAMVHDKAEDTKGTGAAHLITGDCGCMMNIGGYLEKQGAKIQPWHLAEFLWERSNDR